MSRIEPSHLTGVRAGPQPRSASPAGLLGELRHIYLMPDLPSDVLTLLVPAAPPRAVAAVQLSDTPSTTQRAPDSTWEQVFAHVRRLIDGDRRSAA